jgi:hypothetical protein
MKKKYLAGFVACSLAFLVRAEAQHPRDERPAAPVDEKIMPVDTSSGTLNLVLANRNGFVIITDSRRSSQPPFQFLCSGRMSDHCDDSQKLFRTGPKSAVAIAGFAAGGAGTPFDLEIASILRRKFGADGLSDDAIFGTNGLPERDSTKQVGDWCALVLEPALIGIESFELMGRPHTYAEIGARLGHPYFALTVAGISHDKLPHIRKIDFLFTSIYPLFGVDTDTPLFQLADREQKADHFISESAGIVDVADQILKGQTVDTEALEDRAVKKYLARRSAGRLDGLSLKDMKALAVSILRATERKHGPGVGGGDEIGVFTAKKNSEWYLPDLPQTTTLPIPFVLRAGLSIGAERSTWIPDFSQVTAFEPFLLQEEEGRIVPQLFLGNAFRDVTVRVDGNYFIGNHFASVTFLYDGGPQLLADNRYDSCTVIISRGAFVDRNFELLHKCGVTYADRLQHDHGGTIGRALHVHYAPCPPRKNGCAELDPE